MGFFKSVLKSFGLEEDPPQSSAIKPRRQNQITPPKNKYDTFNLHDKERVSNHEINELNRLNIASKQSSLVLFAPTTHKEVQQVIDFLKKEQSCIINLQGLPEEDTIRILDFFSGAIFAISGQITRIQGDLFLATPSCVNIKIK